MLASPAIESPEMAATASGRNSPSSMVRAARATNRPFSVIELKKSGPPSSCPGVETFTAIAISTGTPASTSSPARLRRRWKINRSSERKNLVDGRRRGAISASTADIEALPGQRHEDVLQRLATDLETGHRHSLVHERGHQLLGRDPADHAACRAGLDVYVAQPELS